MVCSVYIINVEIFAFVVISSFQGFHTLTSNNSNKINFAREKYVLDTSITFVFSPICVVNIEWLERPISTSHFWLPTCNYLIFVYLKLFTVRQFSIIYIIHNKTHFHLFMHYKNPFSPSRLRVAVAKLNPCEIIHTSIIIPTEK